MTTVKSSLLFGLIVGLALWVAGCGGSSSAPRATAPEPAPAPAPAIPDPIDYQQLLDIAVENGVTGMVLLIESPDEYFLGSAGVSNKETLSSMSVDAVMPAGSAGKPLIAVLALQLHAEGLLDIDLPITNWLPEELVAQVPFSEHMSFRQLLNHTSGVFEYLHNPAFGLALFDAPDVLRLDSQVIPYALNQPASFYPGRDFAYSNSGYVLAGLILDNVLGYHHSTALRERILEPAGMDATFYLGAESEKGEIISGYRALSDLDLTDSDEVRDLKPFLYNLGVADAPVASTVEDFLRFQQALLDSQTLLDEETRSQIFSTQSVNEIDRGYYIPGSVVEYGLGLFRETTPEKTLLHHGGDQFGWLTHNVFWQEKHMSIVLMLNCGGQICEQQSAELIKTVVGQ